MSLMMKASHAIPKRIHRDTVFLYHSGYLREGSIPGGEARSEGGGLGRSRPHSQTETDTHMCVLMHMCRIWEVQTGLRLLALRPPL